VATAFHVDDSYRDPGVPGSVATLALVFAAAVTAGFAITIWSRVAAGETYGILITRTTVEVPSSLQGFQLASLLVGVVVPVCWLVWQYRVHVNARTIAPAEVPTGAGWGVLCWFVPFVCFVKPFGVVREIDRASGRSGRLGAIAGLWWAAWLVGFVSGLALVVAVLVDVAEALNRNPDPARLLVSFSEPTLALAAATETALASAAVLAVIVVRSITRRQRRLAAEVRAEPERPDLD
jgi:hypothetical protein